MDGILWTEGGKIVGEVTSSSWGIYPPGSKIKMWRKSYIPHAYYVRVIGATDGRWLDETGFCKNGWEVVDAPFTRRQKK